MPPPLPLTLIVATTPSLGIGASGALPWPQLRTEMAYFARVTQRAPPRCINAVLMGRKTWESIPPRFRPLKGRLNVVVSRTLQLGKEGPSPWGRVQWSGASPSGVPDTSTSDKQRESSDSSNTGVLSVASLEEGTHLLGQLAGDGTGAGAPLDLHRVFVIGGAEIYRKVLDLPDADRVLRTRVEKDFECDVFFPLELGSVEGWRRSSATDLDEWTGEEVPKGLLEEKGVKWEFEMWEKMR